MIAHPGRIDGFMLVQLQDLLGDRFGELVDRFVVDGGDRIDLLREAVPGRHFSTIHAEAHGLKGSCRNMGADDLAVICAELEERGCSASSEGIETILAAIEQEFAAVCHTLSSYTE